MNKFMLAFFLFSLLLIDSPLALAKGENLLLNFSGESFSARLENVFLKEVFEELRRGKGIWFKGDPSLLKEKVTVRFSGLSWGRGMRRILKSFDYSLVFAPDGERLLGAIIIGKRKTAVADSGHRRAFSMKASSSKVIRGQGNVTGPLTVIKKSPPGGPAEVTADELANLKIVKNTGPPGGAVEVTEEERKNLKVIKNCPPPGGPISLDAGERESLRIIRNCPPPGN